MPSEKQIALLNYIENREDLDYDIALAILKDSESIQKAADKERNENLTQFGRYLDASKITPSASGMSPGRCPV